MLHKKIFVLICFIPSVIFSAFAQNSSGCSAAPDTRPLPQLLYKENKLKVYLCKVQSSEVTSDGNAYSKAEITEVLYGKTSLKEVKILSGHFTPPPIPLLLRPLPKPVKRESYNMDHAILTDNESFVSSRYSSWGIKMQVDSVYIIYSYNETENTQSNSEITYMWRSKQLKNTSVIKNEIETLRLFGTIFNERKTGSYTFKDEKGKITAQGSYRKGKPNGLWKLYDERGTLAIVENFKNKVYENYYLNGNLRARESEFKDSSVTENFSETSKLQLSSKVVVVKIDTIVRSYITEYDKDGNLYSKHEEQKNRYIGLFYEYYSNGKIKTISEYNLHSQNYRNGIYQQYYPNGQLKLDAHIIDARRVGCWIWYNEDGSFWAEWDYQDGKSPQ